MSPGVLARLSDSPAWTPADKILLVRHRSLDDGRCVVSTNRMPPRGFAIEFDLGTVSRHAQLGTRRLIETPSGYLTTTVEGEVADGYRDLGHVEQAPFPLLDVLELRLDPASGQPVLVAGPADPLYSTATPVAILGFIESFPINPRQTVRQLSEWGIRVLRRSVHPVSWRHVYDSGQAGEAGGVALGGLRANGGGGLVEVRREADGTVRSELLPAPPRGPDPGAVTRWSLAPLGWSGGRPRAWALRAAAGRVRALATGQAIPAAERREPETLGYARRLAAPGWSPLYSARNPGTGDQYLTRSELEATDMGYTVEGVIGYVTDRHAVRHREGLPAEIKWASRFGQRRRYLEGPRPGSE